MQSKWEVDFEIQFVEEPTENRKRAFEKLLWFWRVNEHRRDCEGNNGQAPNDIQADGPGAVREIGRDYVACDGIELGQGRDSSAD